MPSNGAIVYGRDPLAYPAKFYAALHRGTPGDLAFYRRQAEGANAVLELGCGFGRVLAALQAPGRMLVGLDWDPELLQLAASSGEHATLVEGDMRAFDLQTRFDRVFVPHSALYCLLSEDDLRACLACAKRHLVPGGRLVFDAYAADAFHASEEDPLPTTPETFVSAVEVDGESWTVWESSVWTRAQQRIDVRYRHVASQGTKQVVGEIAHRYVLSEQLARLLQVVGFSRVEMRGGFANERLDSDSEIVVVSAVA